MKSVMKKIILNLSFFLITDFQGIYTIPQIIERFRQEISEIKQICLNL